MPNHALDAARIGLTRGPAVLAGIHPYERLRARHEEAGRRLDLVLAHVDVERILAHVRSATRLGWASTSSPANGPSDAGAGLVAIRAVAPHLARREIHAAALGWVADQLAATPAGLGQAGLERVAPSGNKAVIASDPCGSLSWSKVVPLEPDELGRACGAMARHGKRSAPPRPTRRRSNRTLPGPCGGSASRPARLGRLPSFHPDRPPLHLSLAEIHLDGIIQRAWMAGPCDALSDRRM